MASEVQQPLDVIMKHIARTADELTRRFHEASELGRGTAQEIADFREGALRELLAKYFPHPHRMAKGKILDSFGCMSASVDCVLVNPEHPNTIDSEQKFSFLLADGVDCAIELKSDLGDQSELRRGLAQGRTVKKLRRSKSGVIDVVAQGASEADRQARTNAARQVPYVIFAEKLNSEDAVVEAIRAFHAEEEVPIDEQTDMIVINHAGILTNKKIRLSNPMLPPQVDNPPWGFTWEPWGENTVAAFIMRLACMDRAIPSVAEPIMSRYLTPMSLTEQSRFFSR